MVLVGEVATNKCFEISSVNRNFTPTLAPFVVADVFNPTSELVVKILPTSAEVVLPPIVVASDRSATTQGGRSGHSACDFLCHQALNELTHLLLVVLLTNRSMLVYTLVNNYTIISSLRMMMCAEFECL